MLCRLCQLVTTSVDYEGLSTGELNHLSVEDSGGILRWVEAEAGFAINGGLLKVFIKIFNVVE